MRRARATTSPRSSLTSRWVLGRDRRRRVLARYREFHADAGAARIMGSEVPMVNALARLGGIEPREPEGSIKGFGISGGMVRSSRRTLDRRAHAALREHRY